MKILGPCISFNCIIGQKNVIIDFKQRVPQEVYGWL